jgi:hypothetical protein
MKPVDNETLDKTKLLEEKSPFWFKAFRTAVKLLIPLIFLSTGLILLYLTIPGWSLIIGIPSTVFGIVFLLYTYDDITSQVNYDEGVEEGVHQKKILQ